MGPGNRIILFRILQESLMLSTRVPCHFQDDSVVSKWQPLGTGGPQFVHDAWLGSAFNSAFKGGVSRWACSVGGNRGGAGASLVLRGSLGRLTGVVAWGSLLGSQSGLSAPPPSVLGTQVRGLRSQQ